MGRIKVGTVPYVDADAGSVEKLIVAARMDGCWSVLTHEAAVHVYDLSPGHTSRRRIISWLVSREESDAWNRLCEIAELMNKSWEGEG